MTRLPLNKFLINAKLHTYAGGGERREKKLPDGGKEFFYEEGNFQYRDRYYGFNPFAGEEVVWEKGEGGKKREKIGKSEEKEERKAMWVMNYYGLITSTAVPVKEIYAFLRKALRKVEEKRPFRGPDYFREGQWEYGDQTKGSLEEFMGSERILYRGKEVYVLSYNGGRVG